MPDYVLGYIFGTMMAKYVTDILRKPDFDMNYFTEGNTPLNPFTEEIELTFEKLYFFLDLILAKNYEGLKYIISKKKPEFDAKGLQFLKRGPCPFVKETLKRVSEMVCIG